MSNLRYKTLSTHFEWSLHMHHNPMTFWELISQPSLSISRRSCVKYKEPLKDGYLGIVSVDLCDNGPWSTCYASRKDGISMFIFRNNLVPSAHPHRENIEKHLGKIRARIEEVKAHGYVATGMSREQVKALEFDEQLIISVLRELDNPKEHKDGWRPGTVIKNEEPRLGQRGTKGR